MSDTILRDFSNYPEEYLTSQFDNSPLLKTLLLIYLTQDQELHDAITSSLNTLDIDTAVNYQLDLIGKLVGVKRRGRGDDDYRLDIKNNIGYNTSSGTAKDLINYVSNTSNADLVQLFEAYPCKVDFDIYNDNPNYGNLSDFFKFLLRDTNLLSVAGVRVRSFTDGRSYSFAPPEFNQSYEVVAGEWFQVGNNEDNNTLPDLSEAYDITLSCAGEEYMQAGEVLAVATAIYQDKDEVLSGRLPEMYSN